MLHSYPSIYNLGHKCVKSLFDTEVTVEEKVDGSQFSFGVKDGVLFMRSKGNTLYEPVTDKLFKGACEYVVSIKDKLTDGWIFRGEVVSKPRHNTLEYGRTPKHGIVIFDIERGEQDFFAPNIREVLANLLDLETVPVLFQGRVEVVEQLIAMFDRESFLGKSKIEGMVFKNYSMFGPDKKVLMAKWVSEAFKEVHHSEWDKANPKKEEFVEILVKGLKTEARWNKAIQHLREAGKLTDTPRDIGILLKEVQEDVEREAGDEIKERLFEYHWPRIARGVIGGLPEFYKTKLANSQFAEKGE